MSNSEKEDGPMPNIRKDAMKDDVPQITLEHLSPEKNLTSPHKRVLSGQETSFKARKMNMGSATDIKNRNHRNLNSNDQLDQHQSNLSVGAGIKNSGEQLSPRFEIADLAPAKSSRKGKKLAENEEFVDYHYVTMPDGTKKRKRVIKRVNKKIKLLTEEQKEEIDNAFLLFDKDKSGSIDVSELKDAMKALGIHLKKDEVKVQMNKVDKDGSGNIDKTEFTALMAEQIEVRNQMDEMKKVFRIYDDDDNGEVGEDNLFRCAKDLGEEVTEEEVKIMIKLADKRELGSVNMDEFLILMTELGLIHSKDLLPGKMQEEALVKENIENELKLADTMSHNLKKPQAHNHH